MDLCFQYAILKYQSCIFGTCNKYFQAISRLFKNSKAFENLQKNILRDGSSDEPEGNNDPSQESDDDEDEEEEQEEKLHIQYEIGKNLVNLRRTIYLTIMLNVKF